MRYPMREDLEIGKKFPDFELPDHNGEVQRLFQLLNGFPGVLMFGRGHFCPKERRQLTNFVEQLQPEFRVNYCHMISVSVDDRQRLNETRDALGAEWIFLSDADRNLLHKLEMVDATDQLHGEIYIPYTFILDHDLTIHRIYNGWWYLGRPTPEEIRINLRELMEKRKDWIYGNQA